MQRLFFKYLSNRITSKLCFKIECNVKEGIKKKKKTYANISYYADYFSRIYVKKYSGSQILSPRINSR